jgi:hypothetical protein
VTRLVLRVAMHRLVVGARHEPLDLDRVAALVAEWEFTGTRLPVVAPLVGTSLYEIQRGRHRYVAALVRGHRSMLVEVVPPGNAAGPPPRRAEGQRVWRPFRRWAARRVARRPPPPA